jgi:hypothetical protein
VLHADLRRERGCGALRAAGEGALGPLHAELDGARAAVAYELVEGDAQRRHADVVRNRHHRCVGRRSLGALKHGLQREREQQHAERVTLPHPGPRLHRRRARGRADDVQVCA